jgi:hypothetical protein
MISPASVRTPQVRLHIRDLERIDLDVLCGILTASLHWAESGGSEHAALTVTG